MYDIVVGSFIGLMLRPETPNRTTLFLSAQTLKL